MRLRFGAIATVRASYPPTAETLYRMANSLYTSTKDLPFKISGSCKALVFSEHGEPLEACKRL